MHNNRFFRENPKVLQVRVGSNHSRIGGEMVDALEVSHHQHDYPIDVPTEGGRFLPKQQEETGLIPT